MHFWPLHPGKSGSRASFSALPAYCLCLLLTCTAFGCGGSAGKTLFVVGLGTPDVQAFRVSGSGALTADTTHFTGTGGTPQAMVLDPQSRFAYVADSAGASVPGGIAQFTVNRSSGLLAVVSDPSSLATVPPAPAGINPVALAVDQGGKFLFVANQGSSTISVFSIDRTSGELTQVAGSPFSTAAAPSGVAATANASSWPTRAPAPYRLIPSTPLRAP